ncbi:hypothetical protein LMANV2_260067 [Leptospira interrogans serovar Manilae]|uniref:Uncharacterized protein n=1 Tax=Leptospira interrogans serovar Manilae TaxID=214675 RepID=A0AAQ1SNB8_LEPIR|nr:hypothetical protein LMANV2_260067 [Leptospira interrogans serovar Manilae]
MSKKNLGEQKTQHYFHSRNINHFHIGYIKPKSLTTNLI